MIQFKKTKQLKVVSFFFGIVKIRIIKKRANPARFFFVYMIYFVSASGSAGIC